MGEVVILATEQCIKNRPLNTKTKKIKLESYSTKLDHSRKLIWIRFKFYPRFKFNSGLTWYHDMYDYVFFFFSFFFLTLFLTSCIILNRLGHWNCSPFHWFTNFSSLQQLRPHFQYRLQRNCLLSINYIWRFIYEGSSLIHLTLIILQVDVTY